MDHRSGLSPNEMNYRVTHQVSDYILLTFIWEFLNVFLHGMPIVSDLQLPKQNKADIRTTKSKSTKCSRRPDGLPCMSCLNIIIL